MEFKQQVKHCLRKADSVSYLAKGIIDCNLLTLASSAGALEVRAQDEKLPSVRTLLAYRSLHMLCGRPRHVHRLWKKDVKLQDRRTTVSLGATIIFFHSSCHFPQGCS